MKSPEKEIVATLCYSDIFDFPLTAPEIYRYLIAKKSVSYEKVIQQLSKKSSFFSRANKFFYLSGRKYIVEERMKKGRISKRKLQKAQKMSRFLSLIPTILFIGVSGSLAMKNAKGNADIDFFIITKKDSVWITRFCCFLFLSVFGKRRKRNENNPKDTICLNMLIDESHLAFPQKKQNIY
ncbi:MAG: hypothetical protein ACREGI_00450, partial [Candidatus Levyibacteriota bacterium]